MEPSFTVLNGQVRTPLRFYTDARLAYWNSRCGRSAYNGSGFCPYAIPTTLTKHPPFQSAAPLVDPAVTVTSWILYDVNGGQQMDMAAWINQIDIALFTEYYYLIHDGGSFGGVLPQTAVYAVVITSDGVTHTSELFEPTCGQLGDETQVEFSDLCEWTWSDPGLMAIGSINYSGEPASEDGVLVAGAGHAPANGTYTPNGVISGKNAYIMGGMEIRWNGVYWLITDGGDAYESNEDVAEPWMVVTWASLGAWSLPVPTVTQVTGFPDAVDGDIVINLADDTIYTLEGGLWGVSTPSNGSYFYDCDAAQWYLMQTGSWVGMADRPFRISSGTLCFDGNNTDDLTISPPINFGDLEGYPGFGLVTITISGYVAGNVTIYNGGASAVFDEDGTHQVRMLMSFDTISIAGSSDFEGCIEALSFRPLTSDCNMLLIWTNCGNVGNTYYEAEFQNQWLIGREHEPMNPTPKIDLETRQNGRKDNTDTFKRKDTEWRLPIGIVPWHVADALSDIPLHDTITLQHTSDIGSDTLINVRPEVTWPKQDACMPTVELFFQVQDSVVQQGCCEEFEPLCTAIPITGDVSDLATWDLNGGSEFSTALGTEDVAGTPSPDPDMSGYVINLGDNLLYYFEKDTATWNAPILTEGEVWFDDTGSQFYQMLSGVWTLMATNAPVTAGVNGLCFATSQLVEWSSTLPAPIPTGTSIRVRFIIYGVGTGTIFIASEFITWSGEGIYEEDITLTSDCYGLIFVPDSPFTGCLRAISLCALVP